MYASKLYYIWNSGKYFADCVCQKCKQTPAVQLEADCHGDALTLCKSHWQEWFNQELLAAFDEPLDKYEKEGDRYKLLPTHN